MNSKTVLRLLCFIIGVSIFVTGCSKTNELTFKNVLPVDSTQVPFGGDSKIKLDFDTSLGQFKVTDTRNNKVWSNGLTDEYYTQELINQLLKIYKMQLFSLTYCDPSNTIVTVRNVDECAHVTYTNNNGIITAACNITDAQISFELILELKSNTMIATIPADKIKEGENHLVTIELLPFLGASNDNEDGYVFYPDGSGALYEFTQKPAIMRYPYKMQVYGNYFNNYQDYLNASSSGVKWAMLPVFGIKQGNGAVFGTITKGQADTTICFAPSGYIYKANRVYPIYNYRYSYSMKTVNDEDVILFEKNKSNEDFQVQYTFLSGEDANYSGMANTYRDYLLKNNQLKKSTYTPSISLDMLVNVKKPMLLWTQTVTASNFADGLGIITQLKSEGLDKIKINLLGWQSNGYNIYPSHFPVSGAAGGSTGLKNLIKSGEKEDATVSISDNFFVAQKKQGGYSKRNDVASSIKNEAYTDKNKESYLLDFRSALKLFQGNWVKDALNNEIKAINLDDIGRLIYANGSLSNGLRRNETVSVAKQILAKASTNFQILSVSGGNSYTLQYADFLYDIPEQSSSDFLFDKDIPFFQMVVHGYIPYAPEVPGNLSDDYKTTILHWIEYGFVPYFSISEKDASILKDCYSQSVFVSKFSDWKSEIVSTVNNFEQKTFSIRNQPIIGHSQLQNGLIQMVYQNGTKILINYTDADIINADKTVKPKDFLVIEK